jgi:hypothetical protein
VHDGACQKAKDTYKWRSRKAATCGSTHTRTHTHTHTHTRTHTHTHTHTHAQVRSLRVHNEEEEGGDARSDLDSGLCISPLSQRPKPVAA